jgi:hypothetical protein
MLVDAGVVYAPCITKPLHKSLAPNWAAIEPDQPHEIHDRQVLTGLFRQLVEATSYGQRVGSARQTTQIALLAGNASPVLRTMGLAWLPVAPCRRAQDRRQDLTEDSHAAFPMSDQAHDRDRKLRRPASHMQTCDVGSLTMCSRALPAHTRDYTEIGCRFLELPDKGAGHPCAAIPSRWQVQSFCDF